MRQFILILTLFLASTTTVLAQTATDPATLRLQRRQQKLEQLQQRLQAIQDRNKAKIAERINTQLGHINDQATAAYERQLNRMEVLLAKIAQRNVDTTAAQAVIDSAQAAVEEQKLKPYVIEFTEESGLRVGASAAKTGLRADLKALKEKVRLARQAVVDALQAAKTL